MTARARPGKARGCCTWVEDVEVEVPVVVKREVERVRQEQRERFKQDLPADKVLYVDADEVTQAWTLAGTWALEGDIANSNEFRIELTKSDYRHGPVETDRLTVLEDLDELATPSAMSKDISRELELRLKAAGRKPETLGLLIRKISFSLYLTMKSGSKRKKLHLRCWPEG